jgi:hypothetical protein
MVSQLQAFAVTGGDCSLKLESRICPIQHQATAFFARELALHHECEEQLLAHQTEPGLLHRTR